MAGLVVNLKGVYKHPGDNDEWHFRQWASRTNGIDAGPNMGVDFRVSVSFKQGKRRKLKKMTATYERFHNGCDCCGSWWKLSFQ